MHYTLDGFKASTIGLSIRTVASRIKGAHITNGKNTVVISYDHEYEEYRVVIIGQLESEYFTADVEDDRDTAIAMLKEAGK